MNRPALGLLRVLACAGLAGFFAYVVYRGVHRGSDLKYPLGAARLLWKTGSLRVDAQPRYPITLHVLLAPMSALPTAWAVAAWAFASFAAVLSLPITLRGISGVGPRGQVLAWCLAAPFVVDALVLGQADPINLALVSAAVLVSSRGRGASGALLIGLAAMIKILPGAHWATLLVRRRSWDVPAGILLSALAGTALLAGALGPGPALAGLREQVERVSGREKPWNLVERGTDLRPNNESLPIVLARTFGDLPANRQVPGTMSLARLPLPVVWRIWWLILVVLAVAWGFAAYRSAKTDPGDAWLGMFGLTSIITLAVTPICWHHYFLWTLPAALFLRGRRKFLLCAAAASLVVTLFPAARGLGGHMALALVLYALVVHDLSWPRRVPVA